MTKIQILPPLLANQIAAGECIERPSSVVKELVENSLDAQAKNIQIDIEDAGNRLIRISDDGCGMESQDLPLALMSHATSKITSSEDLMNIKTLGFRGEALASIASISEVVISSATRESKEGYQIECKNGDITPAKPTGMAPGTIIEVRNLFYNIPARRKFLKTKTTEMAHITEIVTQLALAAYNVGFKLTHNGKYIFSLAAAQDPQLRIKELLGPDEIEFTKAEKSTEVCRLCAYLGLPCYTRSSNKWQYCYINGRAVKDKVALRSLQDAYQDYLSHKRFAIAVLYFTIDPAYIDVNVHPAKAEVRYRESKEIYELVFKAVTQGLQGKHVVSPFPIEDISLPEKREENFSENFSTELQEIEEIQATEDKEEEKNFSLHQDNFGFVSSETKETYPKAFSDIQRGKVPYEQDSAFLKRHAFNKSSRRPELPIAKENVVENIQDVLPKEEQESFDFWENAIDPTLDRIPRQADAYFQINKTYLVTKSKEGLIIIDQHAFHERLLYNRLREQIQKNKIISQPLLFPEVLHLSIEETASFLEWQSDLREFGISTKCVGNTIEIQSLPQILGKTSGKDILSDLLQVSEDRKKLKPEDVMEKILATMACKAAIKAGDSLTKVEIESLLKAYEEEGENVYYCPHGRPSILKITIQELEKHFKRT